MNLIDQIDENSWVIADTHFGHDNVLQYEPSRVEAMAAAGFHNQTEWLIHNWNSVVAENDLVLHLGDLMFKKSSLEVLDKLNGRIVLLLGNHDFVVLKKLLQYQLQHPSKLCLVQGVPGFSDNEEISGLIRELNGKKIMFSHYPLVSEDPHTKGKSKEVRDVLSDIFQKEHCELCVHGHLHTKDDFTDKRIEKNVSIERIEFKPIRLGELIK